MATCPECDAEIEIDDDDLEEMEMGDPWDCSACGSHLRVTNLDPMEFEGDDEEDEDDDDEEKKVGEDEAEVDETDELDDDADDKDEGWDE